MSRLPQITARQMLSALQRAGFFIVRSRGSHHFLQHQDDPTRRTVIAIHPGDLPQGTTHEILKQARISRKEFLKLL
jgi:predicted RNA binding protein YcfA (HicA-like mRNA interferase family)